MNALPPAALSVALACLLGGCSAGGAQSGASAISQGSLGADGGLSDGGSGGAGAADANAQDAASSSDDASNGAPGLLDGETSFAPPVVIFVPGVSVATIAGSSPGEQDGEGTSALFDNPTRAKLDPSGNLVVVDYDGRSIRLVTSSGTVTTIANSPALYYPFAVAVMGNGSYVISSDNDPGGDGGNRTSTAGAIWTIPQASQGVVASPVPVAEELSRPRGIAPGPGGSLFVVERYTNVVGSLDSGSGVFTAWAGGSAGFRDGVGAQAAFDSPLGAVPLPDGSFAVADSLNGSIRRVTAGGTVTTIAGVGLPGMVDGPCASARFSFPNDVAVDAAGNIYVADGVNERIRRIRTAGGGCTVETLAGNGTFGFANGVGSSASFYGEEGLDVTADGTVVYVADGNLGTGGAFNRIRALSVPSLANDDGGGVGGGNDAGAALGDNPGEDSGS